MRRTTIIPILLLLCLCWQAGPAVGAMPRKESRSARQPTIDAARLEKKIHALINQERKKAGLSALAWDDRLRRIARDYSQEMASGGFFSHSDPEGRDFSDRYQAAGYDCAIPSGLRTLCLGGENLAQNTIYRAIVQRKGKTTYRWNTEAQLAAQVVRQWMASEGHRRNILTRFYRRQGIGVTVAKDGKVYITENFC